MAAFRFRSVGVGDSTRTGLGHEHISGPPLEFAVLYFEALYPLLGAPGGSGVREVTVAERLGDIWRFSHMSSFAEPEGSDF